MEALQRFRGPRDVATLLSGGEAGASPRTDGAGFSALHVACATGWDDLLDRLLKVGASSSARRRPLLLPTLRHRRSTATSAPLPRRLPLNQTGRMDVNAATAEGQYTPLMIAAACGRTRAVEALLSAGASLSQRSRRGATSVHFAAQSASSLAALQSLLSDAGCTQELVNQAGFRGRSPLVLAILCHGNVGIVRKLLAAGTLLPSGCFPCSARVRRQRPDRRRRRHPAGAAPSLGVITMGDATPLHACAHLARLEAMRVLIETGADVNATADGVSVMQECFLSPPSRLQTEAAKRQVGGLSALCPCCVAEVPAAGGVQPAHSGALANAHAAARRPCPG